MLEEIKIAPSILAANYLRLGEELADVSTGDLIHFDVMDGHFVPNLSFGIDVVRAVKSATDLPVDVHLMITNPDEMVEKYLDAGADYLSFHYEATAHAHRLVSLIHERGAKASVALNPATPVAALEPILGDLDMVLVMTVNPGFGGQSFIESSSRKIRRLRRMCDEQGVNPLIEVDGGMSAKTVAKVTSAGANVIVAGSSVFGAPDRAAAIDEIRRAGQAGVSKMA
ncbi:ribulose-phosphate 3-epimerase [Thermophilibacter provencensis]|uniref:Ribulose-phosphate 3-epimerase n=1 Tax=Thermophilibacter provencensis TaxID=1852386 RepID=A0ABT7V310_9ACTN|nr:ribulose-phosphate 3-epimerase [Thermophilibacter provencensis]MDM8270982.1 ribulose-phosphate 3-epimerase [Thermophilibacter provencensis]